MRKGIKKMLKIIGIILLIPIVLIVGFLVLASFAKAVPANYVNEVQTGGDVEAKYLAMGSYTVKDIKVEASEDTKYFYVYYPEELETTEKKYPAVVMLNGTGVLPKKYKALFEHLASWGFIVIGTDDGSSGFGKSADETIDYILRENDNKDSVFYGKIALDNIGITGHSQGGAGVFTAITIMEHADIYKAAVALSPTNEEAAHAYGWNYDLSKVNIPVMIAGGTETDFEMKMVLSQEQMDDMYSKISSPKIAMRRVGADHGQMLYSADGYVTAWFMWQLQGDEEAGRAFTESPGEIEGNEYYQNVRIDLE